MKIIKFEDFSINEARESTIGNKVRKSGPIVHLGILDVVIDDDGKLYDGIENSKLVKGRVQRKDGNIIKILGTDGKEYPAGIEKSGRLVSISQMVDELTGNVIPLGSTGRPLPISESLIRKYNFEELNGNWCIKVNNNGQFKDFDYYHLIPTLGTGWVNIKVDMEIVKRVRRYSADIGNPFTKDHQKFLSKLKEFEEISNTQREKTDVEIDALKRRKIQKEMSTIILLHYINEIKDFFTPSSSGFLFESFLAGLIPDAKVNDNNTAADLVAGDRKYQVKFISENTLYVDVVLEKVIVDKKINSESYLDYYIISVKFIDKIEIYIIDATTTTTTNNGPMENLITQKGSFVMKDIKSMVNVKDSIVKKYTIDLKDIEGRIKNLGKDLKKNLDKLYNEISDFQYNVETIISGIGKNGKRIGNYGFDMYDSKSKKNVENLSEYLKLLVGSFKRDKKVQ